MGARWYGVQLLVDTEDAYGVAGDCLAALVAGDVAHHVRDRLARVGPVVAVVRIVGAPHDVVDADAVAVLDAVEVGDERGAHVAEPVVRRRLANGDVAPRPVAPVAVVDLLEEVRDPAHTRLDHRHVELGKAVEHTGEDQLPDGAGHGGEHAPQAGYRLGVGLGRLAAVDAEDVSARLRGLGRGGSLLLTRPPGDEVDVDAHGHASVGRPPPEGHVVRGHRLTATGPPGGP